MQLTLFRSAPPQPLDRLDAIDAEAARLSLQIDLTRCLQDDMRPSPLQLRIAEALTAEVEAVCDEMEKAK